jgi:thiol-disulfide isomerase/thioredoxin
MTAVLTALLMMPVRPVTPDLVASLAHGKPLVLHFFASWCGACDEEFPHIRSVLLSTKAVLVSVDRPQDVEKAEKMLAKYGLQSLPSLLLDAPDPDPVAKAVGVPKWDGTLPSTFVYDASGRLVRSFLGRADPAKIRAAVVRSMRPRARASRRPRAR